ncbi:uncharacterized protein [Magallana gigas]|uniref:uncharacterized protein n=1 Tax=Magallana gigas TaxID=29159 RepID=UPI00333E9C21
MLPILAENFASSVYFMSITTMVLNYPNLSKNQMNQDFCFEDMTRTSYPLLPLITLRHPIKLLDQSQSCQVCCQSDNSATLNFRYYDPLMENKITLHLSFNGQSLPFHASKTRHIFGSMFHIHFSYPEYIPSVYELRIENRYGMTRVEFEVLNQPKSIATTKAPCTSLACKLGRSVRNDLIGVPRNLTTSA